MKKAKKVVVGATTKNNRLEAVKLAMEQITKAYGAGSIMTMGDRTADMTIEVIHGCLL
jgi:RecA/RadA recombinase